MRTLQDIRYSVANRIETYATTNLQRALWKLVERCRSFTAGSTRC